MTFLIALSLVLSGATSAEAETNTAASSAAATTDVQTEQAKKKKPKKICRDNSATTGSRIGKRVCKTEEEWAADADRQEVDVKARGSATGN
jgi:hypothetical protein